MSYVDTTIVTFGVHVDESLAFHLYESFHMDGELNIAYQPGDIFHRKLFSSSHLNQQLPITPYKSHNEGHSCVFNAHLWANDANSIVHNLMFEKGKSHVFGIYIASQGYAYHDKIQYFIGKTLSIAKNNFEKYCRPILEANNIVLLPKIILLNQIH